MGLDLGSLKQIWKGGTKVFSRDWTGFRDVYGGVTGLFKDKDASGAFQGYGEGYRQPNVSLMRYGVNTKTPGSAGRISALGDTDRIPDWSRNQAVAMYYLNMINKITTQGSDRKGA